MPLMVSPSTTMTVSCPACIILQAASVTVVSQSTTCGLGFMACLTFSIIGIPQSLVF